MRGASLVFLAGISTLLVAPPVAAQFEGNFALSKATYLAGEPIFLTFFVKNVTNEPLLIRIADPLSFCGDYQFELQGARDRQGLPCLGGFAGSCLSSDGTLAPGKTHVDRILLNARYDLRQPGTYELQVNHTLRYAPGGSDLAVLAESGPYQKFEDRLQIVITPSQPDDLKPEFTQYASELRAVDTTTREKAARVIALLAPPFMERTILSMLDSPDLLEYGIEGLRNLGTPSAHRALANFVRTAQPTEIQGPYQTALRYLGEIGDSGDIPVLMAAARSSPPGNFDRMLALDSAGQAGGGAAIPGLAAELRDPSVDTRQDAVRALGMTDSRDAVPILISLLPSPEWRVSDEAEYSLEVLTHRRGAFANSMKPPPPDTYAKWVRWWTANAETAPIFRSSDSCDKFEPLPSL